MIGTACPSESTRRSAVGFHGSFGSHRICLYMSTVTRWASESAVDGWPLPAAVVISTESFPISTAFLCTAASKLMADSVGLHPPLRRGDFRRRGRVLTVRPRWPGGNVAKAPECSNLGNHVSQLAGSCLA